MNSHPNHYDIVIAGAGFSGTITALALQRSGFTVCVIEKGMHPRFAIGESSTPIADMILRSLSAQYDLPWLYDFSRYGSWQQSHPEIVCGIKRGFSYFKHHPGKTFYTDADHSNELLVAASVSDSMSDTNWLRADFDGFLVNKIQQYGIDYFDNTGIISATRTNNQWLFKMSRQGTVSSVQASFFIDATGSGILADQLFGVQSSAAGFLTNSFAVFSHFDQLPRWSSLLEQKNISSNDYPYDPDNSALHHILDEGWAWALRFNNNRTSWGFALNGENPSFQKMTTAEIWNTIRNRYPDIDQILSCGSLAQQPGRIIQSGRLQRKLDHGYGEGWLAMPHSIGFVDPLFSSGIAWSLAGIERIVKALSENKGFGEPLYDQLQQYEYRCFEELKLIDKLVAGCYKTMQNFPLFNAWSMMYFTCTILYEQRRLNHQPVGYFLDADNLDVQQIVHATYNDLLKLTEQDTISSKHIAQFTNTVRQRIAPFNTAGLLNPNSKNMYRHTVAVM